MQAHPAPKGLAQGNEHSGRCSLCPRVGMPLGSSGTKQPASPSTPGEEPPREAGSSVPPPLTGEARAFAMLTGRKQVLLWTRLPGSWTHRESTVLCVHHGSFHRPWRVDRWASPTEHEPGVPTSTVLGVNRFLLLVESSSSRRQSPGLSPRVCGRGDTAGSLCFLGDGGRDGGSLLSKQADKHVPGAADAEMGRRGGGHRGPGRRPKRVCWIPELLGSCLSC